jgi:hypothetical protein
MSEAKSFWTTLPGILTGMAGLITAIGGLLVILDQIGVFQSNNSSQSVIERPILRSGEIGKVGPEPNPNSKRIKELENRLAKIGIEIKFSEEEFNRSPQAQGFLYELEDTSQEREKRLEEIENLQTAFKTEVEQLRLQATDEDAKQRIEQIEGETIPDLEVERRTVQSHVQELKNMIRNAENNAQLKGRIEDLRKQNQSLQEELEYLTK